MKDVGREFPSSAAAELAPNNSTSILCNSSPSRQTNERSQAMNQDVVVGRRASCRKKSTRRCSELIQEFDTTEVVRQMGQMAASDEPTEQVADAEAGHCATTTTASTTTTPARRKNRQCSLLIEEHVDQQILDDLNKEDITSAAVRIDSSPADSFSVHHHRRSSSIILPAMLEDANDVSYHPSSRFQFYAPPRQRQEWGQEQILPRVNWGDLFFDLFYVAAAYSASNILVESPTSQGCLHFLACFLSVQCIWLQKVNFDARFVVADDVFHRIVELLGLSILASIVLHIRPVDLTIAVAPSTTITLENTTTATPTTGKNNNSNEILFSLSLSLTLSWLFFMARHVELYFMGQGQRRVIQACARQTLLVSCVGLGLCLAATIISGQNVYFQNQNDSDASMEGGYRHWRGLADTAAAVALETTMTIEANTSDANEYATASTLSSSSYTETTESTTNLFVIGLLLMAPVLDYCMFFVKIIFLFPNDGSHKQSFIPMNVNFCIHRFSEWTMLLLGESILSLLTIPRPEAAAVTSEQSNNNSDYWTTFYCSLLTVILMQYLHFRSMPHDADDHAMRRSKNRGSVWLFCKYAYSCALIALGAAFTLFVLSFSYTISAAANDNTDDDQQQQQQQQHLRTLSSHRVLAVSGGGEGAAMSISRYDHVDLEQRAAHIFSIAMAITFLSLDGMSVMHVGFGKCRQRLGGNCNKSHSNYNNFNFYNRKGGLLLALRVATIVFVATLSQWKTDPEGLALIGLLLTIGQTVLRRMGIKYLNKNLEHELTEDNSGGIGSSDGGDGEAGPGSKGSDEDGGSIRPETSE